MKKTILIVDDEDDIRNLVRDILEDEGYATLTASNSKEAYDLIEHHVPDLLILDIWLQDSRHDGLQILNTLKTDMSETVKDIPVIMISGHGTIETAVSAIKQGAYDFIEKPFKSGRLLLMVQRGLETAALYRENINFRKHYAQIEQKNSDFERVFVQKGSDFSKNLAGILEKAVRHGGHLFLSGDFGTGKKAIARKLHQLSSRTEGAFIIYECSRLLVDDKESDDHGSRLHSVLEATQSGTLVLDNISMMPAEQQKELLGYLQDSRFTAHIIATSCCNAETLLGKKAFNPHLYSRLASYVLEIPSLQKRREDIPLFANIFMEQACQLMSVPVPKISKDSLSYLQKQAWGGNLHELKFVVFSAVLKVAPRLLDGGLTTLTINDFSDAVVLQKDPHTSGGVQDSNVRDLSQYDASPLQTVGRIPLDLPLREAREFFEHEYLTSQIERFDGNISRTASFVGMERSALHRKLKSLKEKTEDNNADSITVTAASAKRS